MANYVVSKSLGCYWNSPSNTWKNYYCGLRLKFSGFALISKIIELCEYGLLQRVNNFQETPDDMEIEFFIKAVKEKMCCSMDSKSKVVGIHGLGCSCVG